MAEVNNKGLASQYIPDFYDTYPNTIVNVSAQLLDKLTEEFRSRRMNNWDDLDENIKEFKTDETILSNYRVRSAELLKAFFKFKGTSADLKYIIKNIGYQLVLYRDGGVTHLEPDGSYKDIPVQDAEGAATHPCQLEIQIVFADDGSGLGTYNSDTLDVIKTILGDRMALCAFLQSMMVKMEVSDLFDTPKLVKDDFTIRSIIYDKDNPIKPDPGGGGEGGGEGGGGGGSGGEGGEEGFDPGARGFSDAYFDNTGNVPADDILKYGEDHKYGTATGVKRYGQGKTSELNNLWEELIVVVRAEVILEDSFDTTKLIQEAGVKEAELIVDAVEPVKEEFSARQQNAFEDTYPMAEIMDTEWLAPETFYDNAIKTVKFGRVYGKIGQYGQSGLKYRYGVKEVPLYPGEEVTLSINGDTSGGINLTDEVSIYANGKLLEFDKENKED